MVNFFFKTDIKNASETLMMPLYYCHFIIIVSNLVRYKFELPNLFEWQNSRTKMNSGKEIKNNNQIDWKRNNMKIYSTTILKKIIYQPKKKPTNDQATRLPCSFSLFAASSEFFFLYEINIYFDYDWHLVLSWSNMNDAKRKREFVKFHGFSFR